MLAETFFFSTAFRLAQGPYSLLLNGHRRIFPLGNSRGIVQSKVWVCGGSLAGIVGSNPAGGMDVGLMIVVRCQVETSASDWSLVQRSPTDCDVSEYDHESSIMKRPWPIRTVAPW